MIILENYPKINTRIIIENDTYSIQKADNVNKPIQGVGGFSEDGQFVGVFVDNNKLCFLFKKKVYQTTPSDLKCTNTYTTKSQRCFSVIIGNEKVCEIVYKPYIDPGMLYYNVDPEEFDVLLYLSRLLKDEETMQNFIKGMNNIREKYKGLSNTNNTQ